MGCYPHTYQALTQLAADGLRPFHRRRVFAPARGAVAAGAMQQRLKVHHLSGTSA